jgi:hypothetical protein
MLEAYTVYFKEKSKLTLNCGRIDIKPGRFIVYDSLNDDASREAFLSFDKVAALFPELQAESPAGFNIHLRNGECFRLCADYFTVEGATLTFYRYQPGGGRNLELKNTYVTLAEVVAIVPIGGLARG